MPAKIGSKLRGGFAAIQVDVWSLEKVVVGGGRPYGQVYLTRRPALVRQRVAAPRGTTICDSRGSPPARRPPGWCDLTTHVSVVKATPPSGFLIDWGGGGGAQITTV